MEISEIILELKEQFGLKKNHISILTTLLEKDCSADEIVKKTNISVGRIYNLLNELIATGLIEKTKGTPALYSVRGIDDKILNFLRFNFNKQVEKQSKIISMLEQEAKIENVKTINDSKEYDFETIAFLARGNWFKIIHGHLSLAWFIHPRDEKEFWKIRMLINKRRKAQTTPNKEVSFLKYRAYLDVYDKKPIEQIMTKGALEEYAKMIKEEFDQKQLKKWAQETLNNLDINKNVRIYILDDPYSIFTTYISDKEVMSILLHLNKVSGVIILGKKVSDIYNNAFEELKIKSKPIQDYLKQYL